MSYSDYSEKNFYLRIHKEKNGPWMHAQAVVHDPEKDEIKTYQLTEQLWGKAHPRAEYIMLPRFLTQLGFHVESGERFEQSKYWTLIDTKPSWYGDDGSRRPAPKVNFDIEHEKYWKYEYKIDTFPEVKTQEFFPGQI